MANSFSKEERVAFEDILEGFDDQLVLSRNVMTYRTDGQDMERSRDRIWRPMPYIATSINGAPGTDISAQFKDFTQLSVPASLGFSKTVPWTLTAKELRDQLQEGRLGQSARQKLASDVNVAIMNVASNQGTLVSARTGDASGYDDVAECDALMNEIGVDMDMRCAAYSSRDYNKMAGNLAARQTLQGKPLTAYDKAYIGEAAGFELLKLDYANRLTAAAATGVTINGAGQYYTPAATSTGSGGEVNNVDNRYQNLAVTVTSGTIKVGDCFSIADVESVHLITKQATGQAKTFRVTGIVSGGGGTGTIQISPPIISNGGSTDAEEQYQNVSATPANGAAITFLNTGDSAVNPFWHKSALEILPGSYVVDPNSGVDVMRATTDQGFEVVMQKQYDINTMTHKYRLDILFGVVNLQPEMTGIQLFNQ